MAHQTAGNEAEKAVVDDGAEGPKVHSDGGQGEPNFPELAANIGGKGKFLLVHTHLKVVENTYRLR